jgi:hypothetical protein
MMQCPMIELVRQHLHQKPFSPFMVVLRSGRRVEIVDPDKVAIREPQVFAFLPPRKSCTELHEREIELVYVPRRRRFC